MHLTPVGSRCSVPGREEYPKTMQEFQDSFATEDCYREYMFAFVGPKGFVALAAGITGRGKWDACFSLHGV